jgi:hypothetical protein
MSKSMYENVKRKTMRLMRDPCKASLVLKPQCTKPHATTEIALASFTLLRRDSGLLKRLNSKPVKGSGQTPNYNELPHKMSAQTSGEQSAVPWMRRRQKFGNGVLSAYEDGHK